MSTIDEIAVGTGRLVFVVGVKREVMVVGAGIVFVGSFWFAF